MGPGIALGNLSGVHRRQRRLREQMRVRMGGAWEGQESGKSRDTKSDTHRSRRGKGQKNCSAGSCQCLDSSLGQSPTPPLRAPPEQPMGGKCHLWSVRFSSNKAQFYFPYCELTADANTWKLFLPFCPRRQTIGGYRIQAILFQTNELNILTS